MTYRQVLAGPRSQWPSALQVKKIEGLPSAPLGSRSEAASKSGVQFLVEMGRTALQVGDPDGSLPLR
jgi:hypothetical protein